MKVLIVHNYYQDFGGEDVVFRQETEALAKLKGYEIHTLTYQNKKGWQGLLQFFLSPWNIVAAKKLRKKIRLIQPDIIHVHNTQYAVGPIIIRTAKKANIPVVLSLHNFRLLCPSATLFHNGHLYTESIKAKFPWQAVRKRVLDNSLIKTFWTAFSYWLHRKTGTWQKVDRYVMLSQFAKETFLNSSFPIREEQILVKPNFIPPPKGQKNGTQGNYFIYIGRLSEEKGILPLLEAMSTTGYELKIFGSGPQQEAVNEYVDQNSHLHYMGFQEKEVLTQQLSAAKALIVPSVCYEGMPMTILESFGLGKPVLASNLGVLSEMITPGETGVLFEPNNKQSVVTALELWDSLPEDQKSIMSSNCYQEYLSKYTEEKNVRILDALYKELIQQNR